MSKLVNPSPAGKVQQDVTPAEFQLSGGSATSCSCLSHLPVLRILINRAKILIKELTEQRCSQKRCCCFCLNTGDGVCRWHEKRNVKSYLAHICLNSVFPERREEPLQRDSALSPLPLALCDYYRSIHFSRKGLSDKEDHAPAGTGAVTFLKELFGVGRLSALRLEESVDAFSHQILPARPAGGSQGTGVDGDDFTWAEREKPHYSGTA